MAISEELINLTNITQFTKPEELVLYTHKILTVPNLLILFISIFIVLFLVGFFSVKSKKKFMGIYFITLLFSSVITAILVFLPTSIYKLLNYLF